MIDISFTQHQIWTGAGYVIAMLLLAAVFLVKKKAVEPYERVTSILTTPEQYFYKALSSALQGRVLILSKVRIADIIKVRRTVSRKHFWRHFSQISQKHIDFVLIDPKSFSTLCLIELNDKSHARHDRIKRDKFVNRVMEQAGVPLYRFPVRRHYDRTELLRTLKL